MNKFFLTLALLISVLGTAQNKIDWDGTYQLQLSDFQSNETQVGGTTITSMQTASNLEFGFQMSNVEFMFTKNFNSKVSCAFQKDAAMIVAPDAATANKLVQFAQYQFNLSELYARRLRQKIYENKGTFSDITFLKPIYEQIEKELIEQNGIASKATNLGQDEGKLTVLNTKVLSQIDALADFCKACKPPKKKK
ncbi:hypothetical protein [Flavobacterium sp.]|uniref:hypothetical protein n=1 Tax=Flavobacterium sp. TaxID=239 RepID=UPI0026169EB2|nr:hypothetical protein [Flavobacterium sp.]MDG2433358.1 hypothetical protein [Flavobacterium sp.]